MGKSFRLFGMALMGIFLCTSCSNENDKNEPSVPKDPIEDFEQGDMNFTEKAGEQSFTFTANVDWNLSVASTSNGASWCTVSPNKGSAGTQTIKVNVSENDTYDNRSVTITLKAGTESKYFVVTQKQKDAILLTSDKFEVNQQGGTIHIEVKANVEYTAEIGETCKDWIKEAPNTRGLNTTTKVYTIAANEDSEKREGSIVFSDGTQTEIVHVYQAGGDIILLTQNEYYADAAGEDITVELKSNCEYEVEMPDVDWVHEIQTRGMSSHTLYYTIDANESYDSREAKIVYRNKTKETADTLTITQAQKDAIVLNQKEYNVGVMGETIEVKVASNTDYSISVDKDWITQIENTSTKGLTENKYYFQVTQNTSDQARTGNITFSNEKGMKESIKIIQEKAILELLSESEINIGAKSQTIEVKVNSNIPFDVKINPSNTSGEEQINWIKLTSEPGETMSFAIEENKESKERIAKITFINKEYQNYKRTVTITQQGGIKEVTVKATGTLSDLLEGDESALKIYGPLSGADINTLRNMCNRTSGKLTYLDLSDVSIVEGEGTYYYDDGSRGHFIETVNDVISKYMFCDLSTLETIILPKAIISIEELAFSQSKKISSIIIPNNVTSIGEEAFSGCSNLSNITMGEKITSIGEEAFKGTNISTITIPDGITSLEKEIFASCTKLTDIIWGKGITSIGEKAFYQCTSLQEVIIPEGVSLIDKDAFSSCTNLSRVTIPSSVVTLKEAFKDCTNLVSIIISNGITEIWSDVFKGLPNLNEVYLPNSIIYIGSFAFYSCSNLNTIIIPNNVTGIGKSAFRNTGLTNINIPNAVTRIEELAFYNCKKLSSVIIGSSISQIDKHAFSGPIKECRIYAKIPPKQNDSFANSAYAESVLYVPKGCVKAYEDAGWLSYFYNIYEMEE